MSLPEALQLKERLINDFPEEFKCADLINRAIRKKAIKLKQACLNFLLYNRYIYFYTITFDNKTLETNSQKELNKLVEKHLNSFKCPYIYCFALSEQNKRPHYHVLLTENPKDTIFPFGVSQSTLVADFAKVNTIYPKSYLYDISFDLPSYYLNKYLYQSGQFLKQKINYIAQNSYFASLYNKKQHRIILKNKNIKKYIAHDDNTFECLDNIF